MSAVLQELQREIVPEKFSKVEEAVQSAMDEQVFPGGVAIIGQRGEALYCRSFGNTTWQSDSVNLPIATSVSSVFDIGEVTSLIGTIPCALKLCAEKRLSLQDKIARYLHGFGVHGKSAVTLEQVLTHTAGLAANISFHEELGVQSKGKRVGILTTKGARDFVLRELNRGKLKNTPGSKHLYSPVGLLLLGFIIEECTGLTLDKAVSNYVLKPLGLRSTSYVDLTLIRRGLLKPDESVVVPTVECSWRKKLLVGEVFDQNAWAIGGVAGHAGIFSSANDLHVTATEYLKCYDGTSSFLPRSVIEKMWNLDADSQSLAYGWDRPSTENGLSEAGFSSKARGMISNTGCAYWIDPERGLSFLFLTNCCQGSKGHKRLPSFWSKYFSAANKALEGL